MITCTTEIMLKLDKKMKNENYNMYSSNRLINRYDIKINLQFVLFENQITQCYFSTKLNMYTCYIINS